MNDFIIHNDKTIEYNKVILCDRMLNRLGEIYPISNLRIDKHLSSNWECSFDLYRNNDNEDFSFWDDVVDLAIIEIENVGYFEIATPITSDSSIHKSISGVSLGEAELSQTNLTIYFNTTENAEYATSEEDANINCVFYDPDNHEISMLDRIFDYIPHYSIGHVDDTLYKIKRTFSCENTPIYDFLQTIAKEIDCIFLFRTVNYDDNTLERVVDVYTLVDRCRVCSELQESGRPSTNVTDGVCDDCGSTDIQYGYGEDSRIFIDDTNVLAEVLTVTGDKDKVKNCFKITGGDDIINNYVYMCLMGGNKIWKFSTYQTQHMSEDLQNALLARQALIDGYEQNYKTAWNTYTENYNKAQYYQSAMMPSIEDERDAETIYNDIFGENAYITYTCAPYDTTDVEGVARITLNYAKLLVPSTYEIEYLEGHTYTYNQIIYTFNFKIHIYKKDAYIDGTSVLEDEYTSDLIVLKVKRGWEKYENANDDTLFSLEYYQFLKQQMDYKMLKADEEVNTVVFNPPLDGNDNYQGTYDATTYADYNEETDSENLAYNHYTKFSYNRLSSFENAYDNAASILAEMNSTIAQDGSSQQSAILKYAIDDETQLPITEALMRKYINRRDCCTERMKVLKERIDNCTANYEDAYNTMLEIKEEIDMITFLKNYAEQLGYEDTSLLYKELATFRRDDVYNNSNYIADGLDYEDQINNAELLVEAGKKEIKKACELNYSITSTLDNLLTLDEFKDFYDYFNLGSYLRVRVDGIIYKLRLNTIQYDFNDLSHIGVEFIDIEKEDSPVNTVSSLLDKVSSLATTYGFVYKQAEESVETNEKVDSIYTDGLDMANTSIINSKNQNFSIDNFGITGKYFDDSTNAFSDEQIKINNNLLCFTDDNWATCKTALGKIYLDENTTAYGLIAEAIIGKLIMGEQLVISNSNNNVVIDGNGITAYSVYNDNNERVVISINPMSNELFYVYKEVRGSTELTNILNVDANGTLTMKGNIATDSTITGSVITGSTIEGTTITGSYGEFTEGFRVNLDTVNNNEEATIRFNYNDSQYMFGFLKNEDLSDFYGLYIYDENGDYTTSLNGVYIYLNTNDNGYVYVNNELHVGLADSGVIINKDGSIITGNSTQGGVAINGAEGAIELYGSPTSDNTGTKAYIDFHNSSNYSDFTSRFIEYSDGYGLIHLLKNNSSSTYGSLKANIVTPSSRKIKENIIPITEQEANNILELEPVNYNLIGENTKDIHSGLIAEDVNKIYPNVVNDSNNLPSINYMELIPYLIKKIQMLDNETKQLKERVEVLENEINNKTN